MSDSHDSSNSPQINAKALLTEAMTRAGVLREPATGLLYHFTTADGLLGILQSGTMRCSHVDFLNDTSEWEYGFDLLAECLRAAGEKGQPQFCTAVLDAVKSRGDAEMFASCYCEEDDLIPQWQSYASAGSGYAIGFRTKTLGMDGEATLIPVAYGDDSAKARFRSAIDWSMERLSRTELERMRPSEPVDIYMALVTACVLLVLATKKFIFKHENEWRLVGLLRQEDRKTDLRFRNVSGLLVPYVEIPLPKRPGEESLDIASIRCGPSLRDSATSHAVELLLATYGIEGARVLTSEAPLRR